jgi:hypothetical protein
VDARDEVGEADVGRCIKGVDAIHNEDRMEVGGSTSTAGGGEADEDGVVMAVPAL